MKKPAFVLMAVALVLAAALALAACEAGCEKKPPSAAEVAPFKTAIGEYLKAKSMDMVAEEFVSLQVNGDAATAVCKMAVAGELYGGVRVHWRFTFARGADGAWRVTAYDKP